MLAKIRLHKDGEGQNLPKTVDLLRFNEDDIRCRLVDLGYPYDSTLLVTGIEDWGVDYNMTVSEACMLKLVYEKYYDGDEYVIVHQLQRHKPIMDVCLKHYKFLSKEETVAMEHVLKDRDIASVVKYFFDCGSWQNAVCSYVEAGYLLNTGRGFYVLDE